MTKATKSHEPLTKTWISLHSMGEEALVPWLPIECQAKTEHSAWLRRVKGESGSLWGGGGGI